MKARKQCAVCCLTVKLSREKVVPRGLGAFYRERGKYTGLIDFFSFPPSGGKDRNWEKH